MKYLLSAAVFSVAMFMFVPLASASVVLHSVVLDPATVETGDSFDVKLTVVRNGSQCSNNWYKTVIDFNGTTTTFVYPLDTYAIGNGTSTATHTFNAPGSDGTYPVDVEIYSGPETNPNNCAITPVDSGSEDLKVRDIPAPTPSPSSSRHGKHSSLNCKAISDVVPHVFVNEPGFTGCKAVSPVVGSSLSVCQMLNTLGTNSADYCVGITPEQATLFSMDWFKSVVAEMYAKLVK